MVNISFLPFVDHIEDQLIQDNPELVPVDLVENDIDQGTNPLCPVTLVGDAVGNLNNPNTRLESERLCVLTVLMNINPFN